MIADRAYLESFGIFGQKSMTGAELWSYLAEEIDIESEFSDTLKAIVKNGSLATRILKSLAGRVTKGNLAEVYRELTDCLKENRLFLP